MYASYTRLGSPTSARVVTLPRLPRQPATVVRCGSLTAAAAVPTGPAARPAPTAVQRVARAVAAVLLAI